MVFLGDDIVGIKQFAIYGRWGNRVYEEKYAEATRNVKGWIGEFKDRPLDSGVYVYKVIIEVCPGVTKIKAGTLTLIR